MGNWACMSCWATLVARNTRAPSGDTIGQRNPLHPCVSNLAKTRVTLCLRLDIHLHVNAACDVASMLDYTL